MTDARIFKVGVAIVNDMRKLERDYPEELCCRIKGAVELRDLYGKGTLADLSETILGRTLVKAQNTRLGNWAQFPLTDEQCQYAAKDAICSFLLGRNYCGDESRRRQFEKAVRVMPPMSRVNLAEHFAKSRGKSGESKETKLSDLRYT